MFRNIARKYSSFTNIKYNQELFKVNIFRENRSYGKENRVAAIKKFYDITRETHNHNIDSHDNSLYHKSLTNKDSKIHPNIEDNYPLYMDNFNYSSKHLVEDFNKKWKTNLTLEEYYKYYSGFPPTVLM